MLEILRNDYSFPNLILGIKDIKIFWRGIIITLFNITMATLSPIPTNAVGCLANAQVNIRTSSDYNADHGGKNCVLNFNNNSKSVANAWCASENNKNQWIMFGSPLVREFTHFSIQGRGDLAQWVTSFYIKYTLDNMNWLDFNGRQILTANTDQNTVVTYAFNTPIVARSIAIHAETWSTHISLRCELYAKPLLPQSFVQNGSVAIGNRDLWTGTGARTTTRKITFPSPFTAAPRVSLGAGMTDTKDDQGQTRWEITAQNITATGFDCVFHVWGANLIYDLRVDYVAVQTL
ncbi:discoidin II [Tieghemostelium lacteum]|uniref:Discoidin II n=1 Tax=Tieghemostelium lacteum TaxID=361077 RepID=A0A152A295_TIELA|nr:discoidin II [Tieghemostelium lacteum]|eukprot:KYR00330.1 discoidin II [Tieghemostelium lacteum]